MKVITDLVSDSDNSYLSKDSLEIECSNQTIYFTFQNPYRVVGFKVKDLEFILKHTYENSTN